ncbi:MAG TPA: hypothetical protein VMS17_31885 [Gemmataceae bacterium]|nr:hypothetical protein [Gemmataceae bacterium]
MNGGMGGSASLDAASPVGRPSLASEREIGPTVVGDRTPQVAALSTPVGPEYPPRLVGRLVRAASGTQALALIDQAVVSGTSFLTTMLIGRWCGADELGSYALGASLLVAWACVQESLVALPYTIYRHRAAGGSAAECAGSALIHHAMLSAVAVVVLAALAAILSCFRVMPGLAPVAWALTIAIPFSLLREFGRRFAFAHLRMGQALVLDVAVAAVQVAGLLWLGSHSALSAVTAVAAIGSACALTGAAWLFLARGTLAIRNAPVWRSMRQSWVLGKWFFASQVTLTVQGYFIYWLLAGVSDLAATGVYAACMQVALFSNPFIIGLANALAPRAAQAYVSGGAPALRSVVLQTTVLLTAVMVVFCLVVLFGGEAVMALLYRGQFGGHGATVTVLALAMLAAALGMPASNGLAAVERPDLIFKAGLVAVALIVVLIPFLVAAWGVPGAAYGFLAGNVVASAGRWAAFVAVDRRIRNKMSNAPSSPALSRPVAAAVLEVLQQFDTGADSSEWLLERRNEGAQAGIFAARRREGRTLRPDHKELAVKLYYPAPRPEANVVRAQFESLAAFHARLNGAAFHGWTIRSAVPLFLCRRPPALVMTMLPGRPLTSWLERAGSLSTDALESIARAVVAAMQRYWSIDGRAHGDLNFDNILCDVETKSLFFVDLGVLESSFLCDGAARRWFPASRDLAYLLYDTAVAVKKLFGRPGAGRRRQELAQRVLRAFLEQIGAADRQSVLDEIAACVRVHLNGLRASWSPRGMWRLLLRRMAARRIDGILRRLKQGSPAAVGSA